MKRFSILLAALLLALCNQAEAKKPQPQAYTPPQTPSGYPETVVPCENASEVQDYLLSTFTDQGMLNSGRTANTISFEKTWDMNFGERFATALFSSKMQQNLYNYQNKAVFHFTVIPSQAGQCRIVMHNLGITNPGTTMQQERDVSLDPGNIEGAFAMLEKFKTDLEQRKASNQEPTQAP